MSAANSVELIQQKEGRLCVQFYRRPDGTVITTDCPGGVRWRIWKWLRKRRAWAASLFAILVLPACGGMQRQSEDNLKTMASGPADRSERKDPAPTEHLKD